MENDPLQQLRDVHLPPDPSWWPPAFGWWLLAGLLLVLLAWAITRLVQAYRRRAPTRAATAALAELYKRHQTGQINAGQYLHQGNELLKRLLVRAYQKPTYARLSGNAWLTALDDLAGNTQFSSGDAQILGNARFSTDPDINVDQLHKQLCRLVRRVTP